MMHLILKSLWHRRVQNIALLCSIAVGICMVFSVALVQYGVSEGMEKAKQRLGADLLVVPDSATIEPGEILYGGSPQNIYMEKDIEQKIATIAGVKRVTAQFYSQTLDEECCNIGEPVRLVGFDPETDWLVQPWLKNIGKLQLENDEVIVGAKASGFSSQKIFILGKIFRVAAVMEPSGTGMDQSILMNIEEARALAGKSASLQEVFDVQGAPIDLLSAVLVETEADANVSSVRKQIEAIDNVHAFSAVETKQQIYGQIVILTGLLLAVAFLTMLVSLIQLFSRLYSLILERQSEFGLYLALGAVPKTILTIIITEAVLLCGIGSLAGLVLGYGLYVWLIDFIMVHQAFPFVYSNAATVVLLGAGIFGAWTLIGAIAALIPAYRSSHIEPNSVMVRGEYD
ncbi:ABC transporter permease [Anaerosinus massiliensis]|uniref:ABC transporter permease n=1 Tax=Massilibacillus massiliensis TaxID=1806837 RepID=UPI0018FEB172|nr:ABC transporter permease [Massilibacillus massiliensis]